MPWERLQLDFCVGGGDYYLYSSRRDKEQLSGRRGGAQQLQRLEHASLWPRRPLILPQRSRLLCAHRYLYLRCERGQRAACDAAVRAGCAERARAR